MADRDNEPAPTTAAKVCPQVSPPTNNTCTMTKANGSSAEDTNITSTSSTSQQSRASTKNPTAVQTTIPTSYSSPSNNPNLTQSSTTQPNRTNVVPKRCANDFIFGKMLGEGSFSTVYLARDIHTKKEFAIKVCDKSHIIREKKTAYVTREKEALNILSNSCPYFVKLYCTFHDSRQLYFVLTYAQNGDLLQLIKRYGQFDLSLTRYYSCELLIALEVLNANGIIHRDLKPENILLDENMNILITDFGSTKILPKPSTSTTDPKSKSFSESDSVKRKNSFVGTANYVSPELLRDKPCTHACDLWAFGCIIYQMLTGKHCFTGGSDYLIFDAILNRRYEYPDKFPNVASDLVDRLLVIDASERLGALDEQPYTSIREHLFFENAPWDQLHKPPLPTVKVSKNVVDNAEDSAEDCFDEAEPGLDQKQMARLMGLRMDGSEKSIIFDESILNNANTKGETGKGQQVQQERKSIADLPANVIESKLLEQRVNNGRYHDLVEGNLILRQGLIDKKKGLIPRRRMFLLTLGPRIYYVDPATMILKGQIPWTKELRVEVKNFRKFDVVTPNRTYYLEDPEGYALQWREDIEDVHRFYFSEHCKEKNYV